MRATLLFTFFALAALLWGETVINGSRSILGAWNAGGAASTIPAKVGTALPVTCAVGEQFFKSDAVAGQNVHLCTATDTWTQVTATAAVECLPGDMRYVCVMEEFIGGSTTANQVGALGWNYGTGTVSFKSGETPHFGIYRATTGATSGNEAHLRFPVTGTPFGNIYLDTTRVWGATFVFRLSHTTDITFRVGLGGPSGAGNAIGNGFGIGNLAGNFAVFSGAGGGESAGTSLGVALNTNFNTFNVATDGNASKVLVRLNGGNWVTICASGCDHTQAGSIWTTQTDVGVPWFAVRTDTSAARYIDADYFSFKGHIVGSSIVRQ
jgi:hypothetical protein